MVWPAEQSLAYFALYSSPESPHSVPFLCSPVVLTVGAGQERLWRRQSIKEGHVWGSQMYFTICERDLPVHPAGNSCFLSSTDQLAGF